MWCASGERVREDSRTPLLHGNLMLTASIPSHTDLLTPVYEWFTEGLDTADLQEAKALLNELGG